MAPYDGTQMILSLLEMSRSVMKMVIAMGIATAVVLLAMPLPQESKKHKEA